MESTVQFDEKAVEGLEVLFHQFWILRAAEPETYQLIREREKVLRRYLDDKFGLRLIVHPHFIKLEKIPVEPEEWMGLLDFQEPRDYALFCYALAFLEDKSVDEQFLLSELAEEVRHYDRSDIPVDWTVYTHRKSLIRVMKVMTDMSLIRTVDGYLTLFESDQHQEVLYEKTVYSQYMLRTFQHDVTRFSNWEALLQEDWKTHEDDNRRKRVYRQLFFSPALHRKETNDPDFLYVRTFRNQLSDDIENHTRYQLRLFKNAALLTMAEPPHAYTYFPDTKAVTDVVLQLSYWIREQNKHENALESGAVLMTVHELDEAIGQIKHQFGQEWAKYLRDASVESIRAECLAVMKSWMMAEEDEEASMVYIKSTFGLLAGMYPKKNDGEDESP